METLLIPLYGKAMMSRAGIFHDPYAEASVKMFEYDFSKLKIQTKTQVMLSLRAAIIDDYTDNFLKTHPDSMVLHIGCGLDARYFRLNPGTAIWYDLDFPEVTDIKKQIFTESETFKYISSSVTDMSWLDSVVSSRDNVLVIAEGLFMYLSEEEIKALFSKLECEYSNCTIIFDAYSTITAERAGKHTSLKKTNAVVKWGVDAPEKIMNYSKTAEFIETLYLTDSRYLHLLPKKHRSLFRFAGLFKIAREAHRIFIFHLGLAPNT